MQYLQCLTWQYYLVEDQASIKKSLGIGTTFLIKLHCGAGRVLSQLKTCKQKLIKLKKIVSNDKYFLLERKWTQSVAYVFECLYCVCHSDSVGYNDKNIAMNDMCFRQQNPQAHSLSIFKITLSFLSIGSHYDILLLLCNIGIWIWL